MTAQRVPDHLSDSARSWLDGLQDGREWSDTEWRLAQLAAEAWDRSQDARQTLDEDGLVCSIGIYEGPVEDRVHVGDRLTPHPAVAITRDAVAAFARLVDQLGLDKDSKPEQSGKGEEAQSELDRVRARRSAARGT